MPALDTPRFAIIGLGQFGSSVARELAALGAEVLVIDTREQAVESARRDVHVGIGQAVVLDVTDEAAFLASGVAEVDAAVVAIGRNLEASILAVAQLVKLAVPRIVARASSDLHAQILRLIGAHEVVDPEAAMGANLAHRLSVPGMRDRVVLPSGHEWIELDTPAAWWGRTLGELALEEAWAVRVVAIYKHRERIDAEGRSGFEREVVMSPETSDLVDQGDVVAVLGTPGELRRLVRALGQRA